MYDYVGTVFANCTSTNVKDFRTGDDYQLTLPYMDKKITLYRRAIDSNLENLYEGENRYSDAALSEDGAYLAVSEYVSAFTVYVEVIRTDNGELVWNYENDSSCKELGYCPEMKAFTVITSRGIYLLDEATGTQTAFYDTDDISGDFLDVDATGRYVFYKGRRGLYAIDLKDGSLVYEIEREEVFDDGGAAAVDSSMKYFAVVSKTDDSLQLYSLETLQNGQENCLGELKDINATYIESLFFGEMTLYLVYKNGDIAAYPIDSQNECFDEEMMSRYQDLEHKMTSFIQPEGADYSLMAGNNNAYLICDTSEITADINGFLAVDGDRNCMYLAGGTGIYRISVYDEEAIRVEAEMQLGN